MKVCTHGCLRPTPIQELVIEANSARLESFVDELHFYPSGGVEVDYYIWERLDDADWPQAYIKTFRSLGSALMFINRSPLVGIATAKLTIRDYWLSKGYPVSSFPVEYVNVPSGPVYPDGLLHESTSIPV